MTLAFILVESDAPTRSNGVLTGGFGFLNYNGIVSNSVNSSLPTPRTGQLVTRSHV